MKNNLDYNVAFNPMEDKKNGRRVTLWDNDLVLLDGEPMIYREATFKSFSQGGSAYLVSPKDHYGKRSFSNRADVVLIGRKKQHLTVLYDNGQFQIRNYLHGFMVNRTPPADAPNYIGFDTNLFSTFKQAMDYVTELSTPVTLPKVAVRQ